MTEEKTLVSLDGTHNTLVDINGTVTFFKSVVVVTPTGDDAVKKYKVGIVSQEELDEGTMNVDEVVGEYSKTITKNSGDFQNLFLYLQSSEPMKDISVSISTVELEAVKQAPQPIERFEQPPEKATSLYIKLAMAVLIILFGAFMLRRFYKESN